MLIGGGVVGLVFLGLWLFALFDSITAPADQIRVMQKPLWVIIVALGLDLGAIAWFLFGRPRAERTVRASSRGVGPDDDPDFLRTLNK